MYVYDKTGLRSKVKLEHGLPDGPSVGVENEGMDLDSERGHVLLLELARQVTFDERRLTGSAVSDENQLEGWHILLGLCHLECFCENKIKQVNNFNSNMFVI